MRHDLSSRLSSSANQSGKFYQRSSAFADRFRSFAISQSNLDLMKSPALRVYPSAVDLWLIVLLYLGPAIELVLSWYTWQQGRADIAGICLISFAGLMLLNLLLTWPCRYTLTEDSLNIRCGLLFQTLPLHRIRGAELSSSWRSAMALSTRRVRIELDRGYRLVSPVDREAFISDLMNAVRRQSSS